MGKSAATTFSRTELALPHATPARIAATEARLAVMRRMVTFSATDCTWKNQSVAGRRWSSSFSRSPWSRSCSASSSSFPPSSSPGSWRLFHASGEKICWWSFDGCAGELPKGTQRTLPSWQWRKQRRAKRTSRRVSDAWRSTGG